LYLSKQKAIEAGHDARLISAKLVATIRQQIKMMLWLSSIKKQDIHKLGNKFMCPNELKLLSIHTLFYLVHTKAL
jgi:hypothetical protein